MFFKKTTYHVAQFHALLLEKKSLAKWWQAVRNHNTLSFLSTYSTKQLDEAVKSLSKHIDDFESQLNEKRVAALHQLYSQVSHWRQMHNISYRQSKRALQVDALISWIEQELGVPHAQALNKIRYQRSVDLTVDSKATPLKDENLYTWWRAKSNLGLFKPRSTATKQLDKAIFWYSNSLILNRLEGLQQLMEAIEAWKFSRSFKSERLGPVDLLEKTISLEMSRLLKQTDKRKMLLDNFPCSFSFRPGFFILSWLDADLFELFNALFQMPCFI